jgi:acyl-CoA synthetase (AMP-forming)/AMP-acid ligase II
MNVIAIVLQLTATDSTFKPLKPELCLGVLPLSHNFALMAVAHLSVYRGDGVVIAPRFDLLEILGAIHKYKIGKLCLVCPSNFQRIFASLSHCRRFPQ